MYLFCLWTRDEQAKIKIFWKVKMMSPKSKLFAEGNARLIRPTWKESIQILSLSGSIFLLWIKSMRSTKHIIYCSRVHYASKTQKLYLHIAGRLCQTFRKLPYVYPDRSISTCRWRLSPYSELFAILRSEAKISFEVWRWSAFLAESCLNGDWIWICLVTNQEHN